MGTSCLLALASFMAMVAACQLIAGAVVGDWMHTSQIVTSVPSDSADWQTWEQEQAELAFDAARDVLQGWVTPQSYQSTLTKSDDVQDDDGGAIPAGGARVTTEFGLWSACVWTKVVTAASAEPDQKLRCRSYEKLASSGRMADDSPGYLAPTPSTANFDVARTLAVAGAAASGLSLLCLVGITIAVSNQEGSAAPRDEDDEEAPLGTCCENRGPRFPSSGLAGRAALAGGVLMVLAILTSMGSLGAWADSEAAQDLSRLPSETSQRIAFAFGSSFIIEGLGATCGLAAVMILAAGYCWFKDEPARGGAGGDGLLKHGGGGATADYVEAPGDSLDDFEACLTGPDDEDAKRAP